MGARTGTIAKFREMYEYYGLFGEPPKGGIERYNQAPSRYGRKGDPETIIWERLTIIRQQADNWVLDQAIWPLIPFWAKGELPKFNTLIADQRWVCRFLKLSKENRHTETHGRKTAVV